MSDAIDLLIRSPRSDMAGAVALRLVREFQRGRTIADIRRLLINKDTQAIACSVLAELGELARPFLVDAHSLLLASNWETRVAALHFVFCCASEAHAGVLAEAIQLIEDSNKRVRWRCAMLLVSARRELLEAAGTVLRSKGNGASASLVRELLDESATFESLEALACGKLRTERLAAAIAALRGEFPSEQILQLSHISRDPEVHKLVSEELDIRKASH